MEVGAKVDDPRDVRVLVVAADPLARAGLSASLAGQPGLVVVGQIAPSDDLALQAEAFRPEVLLWDLGWSPSSPEEMDVLGTLGLPVVLLIGEAQAAPTAWRRGVSGLLSRESDISRIAAAVSAAAEGLTVIGPGHQGEIAPRHQGRQAHPLEPLTPRETEVLELLAQGLSNRAIAHRLSISEHTVKFHVNAILGKLDAQSRTEAAVRAAALGLIPI